MIKTGLGQDSHKFITMQSHKPLTLAGIVIPNASALAGNSDADVVLHAITNAISSITTKPILGVIADKLCQQGIKDSAAYLALAKSDLDDLGFDISHIAISIEAKQPHLAKYLATMRANIAKLLLIFPKAVGITATTGEGLTAFGCGHGIQVLAIITVTNND